MTLMYETIVNGPFQENCFLVWDDVGSKGILIDPGAEPERLIRTAKSHHVEIEAIYATHGHIDHAGGVAVIQKQLGIPFAIHLSDKFLLDILPDQARLFGVASCASPVIDKPLRHDDTFSVGGCMARVVHTPGHTPGGVCFLFDGVVFVGDTLFAGSIGRTDLPGGSFKTLLSAIKSELLTLDDGVKVLCGHGPSTTIARERLNNPFLTGVF